MQYICLLYFMSLSQCFQYICLLLIDSSLEEVYVAKIFFSLCLSLQIFFQNYFKFIVVEMNIEYRQTIIGPFQSLVLLWYSEVKGIHMWSPLCWHVDSVIREMLAVNNMCRIIIIFILDVAKVLKGALILMFCAEVYCLSHLLHIPILLLSYGVSKCKVNAPLYLRNISISFHIVWCVYTNLKQWISFVSGPDQILLKLSSCVMNRFYILLQQGCLELCCRELKKYIHVWSKIW